MYLIVIKLYYLFDFLNNIKAMKNLQEHQLINKYCLNLLILIKDFRLYLLFYQFYYPTNYLLLFFNKCHYKYSTKNEYYLFIIKRILLYLFEIIYNKLLCFNFILRKFK